MQEDFYLRNYTRIHPDAPYIGPAAAGRPDDQRVAAARRELPEPADARRLLLAYVDQQIANLSERREAAYEAVEAPRRAAAIECGLIDTSKEGQLRQRYERSNELAMHRNLNLLTRHRKQQQEQASAIAPGWSGPSWAPNNAAEGAAERREEACKEQRTKDIGQIEPEAEADESERTGSDPSAVKGADFGGSEALGGASGEVEGALAVASGALGRPPAA